MTDQSRRAALSARLQTIADMVTPGKHLLDVGCDHAYLPIDLVARGVCPGAIVSDISDAALARAGDHIREAQLTGSIRTLLCDGLADYEAGSADALVISGMGGPLMIRILEDGREALADFDEMLLSPQSEIALVRKWLHEHGFALADERMVCDQGKYYVILKAVPGNDDCYAGDAGKRQAQYAYGPLLIAGKDGVLADYLQRETARLTAALEGNSQSAGQRAGKRRVALEQEKEAACSVLKWLTT